VEWNIQSMSLHHSWQSKRGSLFKTP
jgi:hypothetical protein